MDICERIKELIEDQKMTIASFARCIGVGDQTVRGIVVQKRNKPGYDVLLKIVQTFEWLDVEWLITGKGEMRKPVITPEENEAKNMNLSVFVDYLKKKDEKIERLLEENVTLKVLLNGVDRRSSGIEKGIMNVTPSGITMERKINL